MDQGDIRRSTPLTKTGREGLGFGTAPVFLAAISTILGAILFLRFGYAVGSIGFMGSVLIVLIGHAITIPTGLAVAEIATNLKVEGGGEYFIISRSFGATVGGAIGISLYLSQAISVAFYLIAFGEAFRPIFPMIEAQFGFVPDVRMISLPAGLILSLLIIRRGADIGVSLLWGVVSLLAVSLVMFFLGGPTEGAPAQLPLFDTVDSSTGFFVVFAIIFPAFTGMTAGVGLSGDLRNPRRSIPMGTLTATLTGLVVYIFVIYKLSISASPDELAGDQFVMSKIAIWGPIIPIGLAASTVSSAIGSILVAPRTLQALCLDRILPWDRANRNLARGRGDAREPINATWLTSVIVVLFVSLGDVNFVAKIISMFFMITYGALCAVSFLEHFAGNPSYRPTFRTKWYISLVGAIASLIMMFQMQPVYALLAILSMSLLYLGLKQSRQDERDLSVVMRGVLLQMTRQLQVLIQKRRGKVDAGNWRPSFVAVSPHSLSRLAPFDFLRWLSHYYGFGTYIHYIPGPLTFANNLNARDALARLIKQTEASRAGIYADTIIAPSFKTAIAQIVQIPGIAGMENNSILFEFEKNDHTDIPDLLDGMLFAAVSGWNICILRSSDRHFGYYGSIHIWLNPGDYRNANLMILLAYILIGHPDWKKSEIKLFVAFPEEQRTEEVDRLNQLISEGRIPISPMNVHHAPFAVGVNFNELMAKHSSDADLVITGLSLKKMHLDRGKFLKGFSDINDMLFVRAGQDILITYEESEPTDLDAHFAAEAEEKTANDEPDK
jgi:amino acid transporter